MFRTVAMFFLRQTFSAQHPEEVSRFGLTKRRIQASLEDQFVPVFIRHQQNEQNLDK